MGSGAKRPSTARLNCPSAVIPGEENRPAELPGKGSSRHSRSARTRPGGENGGESPNPASTPTGAVFLSCASQDTEAAQTICEALRAAGVEVWFDQCPRPLNIVTAADQLRSM